MAPRGMSAEEKKAVVLDVFRAAEAPFSMKEIEKAAGAKKGLHPMAIKELVVALANDGKVRVAGEGRAGGRAPPPPRRRRSRPRALSPPPPRPGPLRPGPVRRPRRGGAHPAPPPCARRPLTERCAPTQVNTAKIGVSTYYWSFPAEATVAVREAAERLGKQRQELSEQKAALEAEVKERSAAGGASAEAECERLEAVLEELGAKEAGLGKEVQAASSCDPERYRKMKEGATTARDSANRWIENIWALESWMKKKFSGREEELKQHFKSQGVPEDLDTFQ